MAEYRVRGNDGKLAYRKTIGGSIQRAAYAGSVVEKRDELTWSPVGLAFDHELYEDRAYVDAFNLFKRGWQTPIRHSEFGFKEILVAGEIKFPRRQCGLDNYLMSAKAVNAITAGDEMSDHLLDGLYHYVVTSYGRKLGAIIQELFLDKPRPI